MNIQEIYYSNASCGAGKTEWAVRHIGQTPGRYIYVVDRTAEFAPRHRRISEAAAEAGRFVAIRSMSSEAGDVVSRDFPLQIERLRDEEHIVLIITHEAMKRVDHSVIRGRGWSIIIDEDPKVWSSGSFDLGASTPFWEATYSLEPFAKGYSKLLPRSDAPSSRALAADDLTRPVAALHSRVQKGGAVINLEAWEELQHRRRLTYFSIWDVAELAVYDQAIILANSFDSLITYRLSTALCPDIVWKPMCIGKSDVWLGRDLTINYVATDHRAGSTFFETTESGRRAVKAWSKWVGETVDGSQHFWAANKRRGDLKLPGVQVSPKIAGSNAYRALTQCSILYSAKASDAEHKVFAAMTGGLLDHEAVRRDREFEDLIQIVFRSSLRMPNDPRPVTVNVYDREQATFLADYFRAAGFPFRTTLNFVDLGLTYTKAKPGRKADPKRPPKTAAERARDYRARKAAA